MKELKLNPTNHEIKLAAEHMQDDGLIWAQIEVTLCDGGDTALGGIKADEARKIGEWFLKLSKELDK